MGVLDWQQAQVQNLQGGGKGQTYDEWSAAEAARREAEQRAKFGNPDYDWLRESGMKFAQELGGGPFREQQLGLAEALGRQMRGQDSLSAEQLRQSTGRLMGQQQAFASSARPSQSAMAARLASQGTSRLGSALAGQQAMAGIAERNAAANSLGSLLTGGRAQDIGAWQAGTGNVLQNAGMQQAGNLAFLQDKLQRDLQPGTGEKLLGAGTGLLGAYLMRK